MLTCCFFLCARNVFGIGWVFFFVLIQGSSVVVILLPVGVVVVVFLFAVVGKGDAMTTDLAKTAENSQ